MKQYSAFDVIGPDMIGPSSSHTAGANRLGAMARKIARGDMGIELALSEVPVMRLIAVAAFGLTPESRQAPRSTSELHFPDHPGPSLQPF